MSKNLAQNSKCLLNCTPRTPAWVRERVRAEKRLRRGWKGEEEFDVAYARQDSWYNQGISIFMIIIFNDN